MTTNELCGLVSGVMKAAIAVSRAESYERHSLVAELKKACDAFTDGVLDFAISQWVPAVHQGLKAAVPPEEDLPAYPDTVVIPGAKEAALEI